MSKVKAYQLRKCSKDDLLKQLEEMKAELSQLRIAQATGSGGAKLSKIHVVRKNIARVLTVFNQTQRAELRKHYRDKKYTPIDLRRKKTRAMRRKLNKAQKHAKSLKTVRKIMAHPKRIYALRA